MAGESKTAEKERMVTAIVSKGHTVMGAKEVLIKVPDGDDVVDVKHESIGPGESIHLPASEAVRLRGLGYLEDPKAKIVMTGDGPSFSTSDGPSVQALA